jgi:hypothetical protein
MTKWNPSPVCGEGRAGGLPAAVLDRTPMLRIGYDDGDAQHRPEVEAGVGDSMHGFRCSSPHPTGPNEEFGPATLPTASGGRDKSCGRRSFSYAIALPRKWGRKPFRFNGGRMAPTFFPAWCGRQRAGCLPWRAGLSHMKKAVAASPPYPSPTRGRVVAYGEIETRVAALAIRAVTARNPSPLVGRVGRAWMMRSIVQKRRPGWGVPQALPSLITPTRPALWAGHPPHKGLRHAHI